ncbi:MAG TPA: MlaD family protein [Thermoanaerobaculia bacterium]|jgi:phospholipid/cholesterol/gamma-HCH transport system substrate-binding protein
MAPQKKEKTVRVGLLVAASALVLMVFLFFIGSEQKIFSRKNEYRVRLDSVTGLAEGNPVKISGVTVGVIKDINLPRDPKQKDVDIQLMVDRKFQERIRSDSRARLKKLGLLAGDSYIDISPGSPRFDMLEPGALIPAARQTNVDQLISSGEDLVDNFVQISYSLKNILSRVDRGEGLLGELTTQPETKQRLTDTVMTTLNRTNAILAHVESGRGVLGKLIYDDKYAEDLTGSLKSTAGSLQTLVVNLNDSFKNGQGPLPALLNDAEGKKKVYDLINNLNTTSANLAAFSDSLKTGQGLLPRLMNDKAYADQSLAEFTGLVHQLSDAVAKINNGQGTAGKIINDPSVYESINDILIGINESKLLRWLIRNRQEKGIEKRYEIEQKRPPAPPAPSTSTAPPPSTTTAAAVTTTSGPPPQ